MTALRDCVLIVDDEFLIAESLRMFIEDMGMEVCAPPPPPPPTAVALAEEHRPSLVLMDVRLRGEQDGVDAALAIHHSVGSKVIFITGSQEPSTLTRIKSDHPSSILFKPVSGWALRSAVESAIGRAGF